MQRENFTRSHCKSERRESQKLKLLLECIIHLLQPIHEAHCGHFSLPGQINPLEADTASRPRTGVSSSDRWDSYMGFQVSEKNPSKCLSKYHGGGAEMGQRVLQRLTMWVPFPRTRPHNLKGRGGSAGIIPVCTWLFPRPCHSEGRTPRWSPQGVRTFPNSRSDGSSTSLWTGQSQSTRAGRGDLRAQ